MRQDIPLISPADEQRAQAVAAERGLSLEQARELVAKHGHDEDKLAAAVENMKSFLRAPS